LDAFPAQRQPKNKVAPRKIGSDLSLQEFQVCGVEAAAATRFPLVANVAVDLDLKKRVDDRAERFATFPFSMNHEGVAEMEHRLLAETELPDRRAVGGLAAFAERRDPALVFWAKEAVIDRQKSQPAKKRVRGIWPPRQRIEPKPNFNLLPAKCLILLGAVQIVVINSFGGY
jgi:hypothetical protein